MTSLHIEQLTANIKVGMEGGFSVSIAAGTDAELSIDDNGVTRPHPDPVIHPGQAKVLKLPFHAAGQHILIVTVANPVSSESIQVRTVASSTVARVTLLTNVLTVCPPCCPPTPHAVVVSAGSTCRAQRR